MSVVEMENAEPVALTVGQLQDEIAELASHIYAGSCRWLELIAELDRRGSFTESGAGSCAEWLAWRCGLMPRSAREHVRVARRLCELPRIRAAFSRGELSYAKVRALTRVASMETEEELLELAACMTAAQLDRAVRCHRRVTNAEVNELQANAYVGWCWDEVGWLLLHGRLAPEDGALFLRALEASRDSLWKRQWAEDVGSAGPNLSEGDEGAGSAEPPGSGPRPTNAEALVAISDAALGSPELRSGGERYQVALHVDAAALSSDEERGCSLEDGPAVAVETARRLACDASVVDRGRKRRTASPALRRALRSRDRGCRFPGCENRRFVDAHHIRHWARGGEARIDNLVLLCTRHHRFVHEGGYAVDRDAGGEIRFFDSWGKPILDVPRPPPSDADRILDEKRAVPIDAWTYDPGYNDPMDLDLAFSALKQILA